METRLVKVEAAVAAFVPFQEATQKFQERANRFFDTHDGADTAALQLKIERDKNRRWALGILIPAILSLFGFIGVMINNDHQDLKEVKGSMTQLVDQGTKQQSTIDQLTQGIADMKSWMQARDGYDRIPQKAVAKQ